MTLEVVKMPTKEDSEQDRGQQVAFNVIKKRFLLESLKTFFPYFVFAINSIILGYCVYFPDTLRLIGAGIFFTFSVVSIRHAKMLWKE